MTRYFPLAKLRVFAVIWFGQVISMIGSGLTAFALGVWLYERTGSVTPYALNGLAYTLPMLLLSPVAGAWADRYDRRRTMILSDCGAAVVTLVVALLARTGSLSVWQVYAATAALAALDVFQRPAYMASIPLLVPKEHLGRTAGMVSLAGATSSILAPAFAGVLLIHIGLEGIIAVDLGTFLVALGTLLAVRIPRPPATAAGQAGRGSFVREALAGWAYIGARRGLLAMTLFFALLNLAEGMSNVLRTPLVLSFTSPASLGSVMSAAGVGALIGSLTMSAWGGPRRKMVGVFAFTFLAGAFQLLSGLAPSALLVAVAFLGRYVTGPLFSGCSTAIWQAKVAADLQGRVFAATTAIRGLCLSLVYVMAGPLADRIFEPLLAVGGPLAPTVGRILGTGAGRGIGLLMSLLGLLAMGVTGAGFAYPRLRLIEEELPDAIPTTRAAEASRTPARGQASS